jgi:hypothetical protein
MKQGRKTEICVIMGALLSASAIAVTPASAPTGTDSPYDAIVERNVFNLHAPPPPVNPADLIKKTPPPKITLTGITTILGQKKTFLTTPPLKPGTPPESVMLAEGQAINDIEVKRIDEKAGVVEVINHGEAQTLDFEHDGAKISGAPAMPVNPQPMSMPPPAPPPANISTLPTPGTNIRPLRSLAPRSGANNGFNNGFGGGGMSPNGNAQAQQSPMTPEEQVLVIEAQRVKLMNENNPMHKIFPNTEMTPEVTGQQAPSGF